MINKVLIITSEPFPIGMAGTNRIISLGKGFYANGINTKILSISKTEITENPVKNPIKGTYEGLPFESIFSSRIKNRYKFIRGLTEYYKSFAIFLYCLKTLDRETLIIYYSLETLPAIFIGIANRFRGGVFFKDETEHPSLRVRSKIKLFKYLYIKYHYKLFDGLFVITQNLYNYFKNDLKYNKALVIVPMIVDVDRFENHPKNNLRKTNNSIVFTGTLDDQKEGVDLLIRAFSKVLKRYRNYTLNLYGEANERKRKHYSEIISDLGIDQNVIIHGFKSRAELTIILLRADILIFTRPLSLQATYGFSTKLGEYLATGKPIVAARSGEIENYLKDRQNAFICDANEDSIASKVCEIIEDYSFAQKVGNEGKLCVYKFFNNKVETKKVLEQIQNPKCF